VDPSAIKPKTLSSESVHRDRSRALRGADRIVVIKDGIVVENASQH
jgi:hypothetical protein